MSVTARVFPGLPEHAALARHWVRALAASTCPPAATDAELATAELVTNALAHTRSGLPGGTVTVAVAAWPEGVSIHVHDQGTPNRQPPRLRPLAGDGNSLGEGGRGLVIVATVSAAWGSTPAGRCSLGDAARPAPGTSGRCTWCHLQARQDTQHRPEIPTPGMVRN